MLNKKHIARTAVGMGLVTALAVGPVTAQMGHMTDTPPARGGAAPGYGMPGWGWGMMGPGMMGPGMMGPGMMGPGMMGPGMMGWSPAVGLNLTGAQQKKMAAVYEGLRKKQWELMNKMMGEAAKLHELYAADKRDPKKIGAVYGRIFDYKRKMIEAAVEAANQRDAILTKEQKARLRQWGGMMMY